MEHNNENQIQQRLINLSYFHGQPTVTGNFKVQPEHFTVKEDLSFELTGEGEHQFVSIQKRNCTTLYAVDKLAQFAGISPKLVSYAGLKDSYAVTEQWINLHLPGKNELDFSKFDDPNIKIIQTQRHNKKLKIGALKGNYFSLILSDVSSIDELAARIELVKQQGFPNYFGEQRFGHDGGNIIKAFQWANNQIKVKDRKKRSFYLSATRSYFFNQIVSERIQKGLITEVMQGDVMQLVGSHSHFVAQQDELESLQSRVKTHDLVITAPLIGDGALKTEHDACVFEQACLNKVLDEPLINLIKRERVATDRRAMMIMPVNLSYKQDQSNLMLDFWLPAGSYATSLVRELMQIR